MALSGPLWHVSVAIHQRGGPLPVSLWSDADVLIAARAAERALRGVGDPSRHHTEAGDVAFHLRRPTTVAEAKLAPRRRTAPAFPIEQARR